MRKAMKCRILVLMFFVLSFLSLTAFTQEAKFDPLSLNMMLRPHRGQPEWRWTPDLRFDIHGPLSAGGSISVEYTLPTGKAFVKMPCWTEKLAADESMTVSDCGRDLESTVATNLTGVFGFQIKLADELNGINKVLYSGKFSVNKYLYNPAKTAANAKNFYYFIEYDWRLPYADIGTMKDEYSNNLYCKIWIKNETTTPDATAYLIFNGKTVSEASYGGYLSYELEDNDAHEFMQLRFKFNAAWEKRDAYVGWKLDENPGEYEIKVLRNGQLTRTMKFGIGKDGRPADNGTTRQNKLLDTGIIVPAQVLGDTDGKINRLAFKEGIWGNPIAGFTPPQ